MTIDVNVPDINIRKLKFRGVMDASTLPEHLVDQFCAEAKEDLIGLWEMARQLERETGPGELAREQTLAVVRALLARGLRAGDPPIRRAGTDRGKTTSQQQ